MCIQNEAPIRTETNMQYLLLLKFSVHTSARRHTRSGGPRTARTGAERRHRTFEPCQGSKKRTIPIWYRSFFKRETGIEAFSPVARVFQRLAPWKPCNGEKSIRPLHWLLCFSSAKSWGAAVGGSITPNF